MVTPKFVRRGVTLLALLVGSVTAQTATAPTEAPAVNPETGVPESWPDPAALRFGDVTFNEPEPQREVLSNGLTVYLLEDHSLPLVSGAAFVKTGSMYDPENKSSLAVLTADLMRSGGSAGRSADEIDERLETLAAAVEVSAADLYTTASFSSLTENVGEVLDIFAGVLEQPAFAPARIDLAKGRVLEGIRRENDDPVGIAVRELYKRIAKGHPAGYIPTARTVNAVSRADMVSFHARYFKPNEAVLAVSGDFDSGEMVALLEQALGDWQRGKVSYPELPPYPDPAPRIYHAQKDLGQSIVLMGRPSVYAYTPEYSALDVANAVLGGGGFSSRIFTEVRTKRGLAYSAGSQVEQGFVFPGTFLVYAFTRTDATGQVIELLQGEMRKMAAEPPTTAELEVQKSNILNGAVFRFTSPAAIVQRTARAVEVLGLPAGYYDRYTEQVEAMTPAKVQEVARREFRPDDMLIMVVGDAAQFDRPLSDFGEVEEIALELPTP
jgi:predicted Zn-dependent peptidase